MIARSDAAKFAKAIFYAGFNDIDVFVEDTAEESKKVYVEILSRVFEGKLAVTQIFPIGPKPTVIKRCGMDQGVRSRPAVYIIDGDYDVLFGVELPALKRLYRLDRYCIENYLLDADAVIDIACDESTQFDEIDIRKKFDFEGWAGSVSCSLKKVVVSMAVSRKKQCGLPTVKINMAKIQGAYLDHVDVLKVKAFENEYESAVDGKFGEGTFRLVASEIESRSSNVPFFLSYGSGKSLLMPLLRCRIKRRIGLDLDYPKLRVKLARRCDISELANIKTFVS